MLIAITILALATLVAAGDVMTSLLWRHAAAHRQIQRQNDRQSRVNA